MRSLAAWAVSACCGSEGVITAPGPEFGAEFWAEFCAEFWAEDCDQAAGRNASMNSKPRQPLSSQLLLRNGGREKIPTHGERIGKNCPPTHCQLLYGVFCDGNAPSVSA